VLTVLREPILIDDSPVFVSGSIGVAVAPQDGADAEVLLHHANIAMYAAKQDGRDRRAYFRAEMDALAESRADLRHGLASAVRRREFVVHYQPILDARTGAVASVEALVRWQREGRAVPATDFLGLAEETGQLTAIGQLAAGIIDGDLGVLDAALAGESPGRPPALCVNVSSQQLDERHFVDWLLAWKPPGGYGRVVVEVTESAALARGGRAVEALGVLRRLGARLSIDDFGTGYSNLEILERLRPDVVKIDRSLLIRGQETPWGFTVLRAAVQLGHAMEAEVVVEGVENEALLQLTRTLDAEYLQGYHLAEPMAVADLARWCSRRRTS
jgi:two-component system CheB/CheR fusion protein